MDYYKLKKVYGRLYGIKQLIDAVKFTNPDIGNDYNSIIDELNALGGDNYDHLKIPSSYQRHNNLIGRLSIYSYEFKGKLYQLISALEYSYNLNESILTIGSIFNSIQDSELKSRCADLLSAPGNFDRAINQATQVLEDRIRGISNSGKQLIGVDLVNKLIKSDPNESVIVFSEDKNEQDGYSQIIRGLMMTFRNQTHHYITDKFTREDSLKLVVFIDTILLSLNRANVKK